MNNPNGSWSHRVPVTASKAEKDSVMNAGLRQDLPVVGVVDLFFDGLEKGRRDFLSGDAAADKIFKGLFFC